MRPIAALKQNSPRPSRLRDYRVGRAIRHSQGAVMRKALFFLVILLSQIIVHAADSRFTLGVHPYLDAKEIQRRFEPLAAYLSLQLGREVQVRVGIDYLDHIQAIGEDRLDLAYLGPASYVEVTRIYGTKPILARVEADGKPSFYGYVVVLRDSPLERLADLRGKRFAFGDPDSTMGTLVPRWLLLEAGVDTSDLAFYSHVTGHKNVALAVLAGAVEAGAVKEEIFDLYQPRGLRSLARSPAISEHLFVTRANLDADVVTLLRQHLLGLREAGLVERVLAPIKSNATALVPADDSDYDNLRRIVSQIAERKAESRKE